ncbi:hypothetical protein PoB_004496200 [Plakobranchus ocellatus]|uniref:Uncharacterized protein n=1 Tax=Plakobranchus ocellatus TaxID=259542 RepID=A0AAV4BGD6_9GAST|nr:hypothetical protein PoB_004496200 [Plakobranchus ocellatus]
MGAHTLIQLKVNNLPARSSAWTCWKWKPKWTLRTYEQSASNHVCTVLRSPFKIRHSQGDVMTFTPPQSHSMLKLFRHSPHQPARQSISLR